MNDWLPEDDLVYFIMDVIRSLDLNPIYQTYNNSKGGQPPYPPMMMVSLLLYAYCIGPSSRKIEKTTYHSIAFRVLTANQHPDHDTISDFRKRHLKALATLFVDVLLLCQKAGLVKLGHVSLDGTKMNANASKHKAMSYVRMEKKAAELQEEVARLLAKAETIDADEDVLYGKGNRKNQLPKELSFKQSRLMKIQEAKKALEAESLAETEAKQTEYEEKKKAYNSKTGRRGRPPKGSRKNNFTFWHLIFKSFLTDSKEQKP